MDRVVLFPARMNLIASTMTCPSRYSASCDTALTASSFKFDIPTDSATSLTLSGFQTLWCFGSISGSGVDDPAEFDNGESCATIGRITGDTGDFGDAGNVDGVDDVDDADDAGGESPGGCVGSCWITTGCAAAAGGLTA